MREQIQLSARRAVRIEKVFGKSGFPRRAIAVDLAPLRPGGENGGLKPAIFNLLRGLREQSGGGLFFVFLTNCATRAEVREFVSPWDVLICVAGEGQIPPAAISETAGEFTLVGPPTNFLGRIGVDLLYCPFGAATFHCPGIPTVALIADLLHRDYPLGLSEAEREHREKHIQHTLSVATKIQSISRSGIERIREHYGVAWEKLFWTYLPILTRMGPVENATVRNRPPRPYFFYPANVWPHKNHELLLRSYAEYRNSAGKSAWDLVLTFHQDPRVEMLESLARELGIISTVRFAGFVSEAELAALWQGAGALVFPSLHEGFGIPLLEAMHYGVPIIAGAGFALKEVGGDAVYRVDSRKVSSLCEGLLRVSKDEGLRRELTKRGRARLQLFDCEVAVGRLLSLFKGLTGDGEYPRRREQNGSLQPLTVATPACPDRWEITIFLRTNSFAQKLYVFLDQVLFADWIGIPPRETEFAFHCQPRGRLLQVSLESSKSQKVGGGDSSKSIDSIVGTSENGERVLLYEGAPEESRS